MGVMNKNSKIKTIIFDLGNVLINYDARIAAKKFSKKANIPLMKVWLHFFTSPTEKAYTRGEITSYAFYKHSREALGTSISFQDFSKCWNEIFKVNPGMESLVRKLKKNYPLYLISNTNKLHYDYLRKRYKVLNHFKKRFPSHIVGMRKPDIKIYKHVLKHIRFRPEETVFIDDASAFVRGAKKAGMNAIQFRSKPQLIRDLKKLGVET